MTPKTRTRDAKNGRHAHSCDSRLSPRKQCAVISLTWSYPLRKGKRMWRCVMNVLVTTPACSHQRPERHAYCRVRDDGVPVLHGEPICTRLRQLRVVLQEFERDDLNVVAPRPESKHNDTCKTKAQIWARRTTQRAIHHTNKKRNL